VERCTLRAYLTLPPFPFIENSRNGIAPSFPARVSRSTFYEIRQGAINRRGWPDLCADIAALKYTNVPLIGLSPPVRTIKAALGACRTQIIVDRCCF